MIYGQIHVLVNPVKQHSHVAKSVAMILLLGHIVLLLLLMTTQTGTQGGFRSSIRLFFNQDKFMVHRLLDYLADVK
jgi:hypothetical protein